MEEKFKKMGLLNDNDLVNDVTSSLNEISLKESVEGQEWRAEI